MKFKHSDIKKGTRYKALCDGKEEIVEVFTEEFSLGDSIMYIVQIENGHYGAWRAETINIKDFIEEITKEKYPEWFL